MKRKPSKKDWLRCGHSFESVYGMTRKEYEKIRDNTYRDRDWLRRQYIYLDLNVYEIAEKCDVSWSTIHRYLHKYNLLRNGRNTIAITEDGCIPTPEMFKQIKHEQKKYQKATYRNVAWLYHRYIQLDMTMGQIAQLCGVDRSTIRKHLRKHGIRKVTGNE